MLERKSELLRVLEGETDKLVLSLFSSGPHASPAVTHTQSEVSP